MMLKIVDGYSRDFKVKFGGDKSKVMVINGDETDRDREWNIGEVKIGRIKEYKYLGCMLSEDGCARAKGEKVWNARCVEEDSGMRYLVGLDEECNMTFVDAMKDFLVYAWNKRQGG
ncbi:hypothetical protein FHG87_016685 [Trinorchestia longiramus]|nr:hypothetical protein FHG87_016685 [Trinorchestia longiramus]